MADRKAQILDVARRDGRVSVEAMAARLGVSAHTIRRDINSLCNEAKLRRRHGGAEFVKPQANIPYPARAVLNFEAKVAIARAAARFVPDGSTVFISIGTTPSLVAGALARKRGLTVVTNNLNAAMALSDAGDARIILPGGELRLPDRDILCAGVTDVFAAYRADYGIYGVGGIDSDGSLLDFHEAEVRVRACIHAGSRTTILVADQSKFGRVAAAVGGHVADADHVVIDRLPDSPFDALLAPLGDRVVIADAGGDHG